MCFGCFEYQSNDKHRQVALALQGKTNVDSAEDILSDENHDDSEYVSNMVDVNALHDDKPIPYHLGIYCSLRIVPLYHFGYYEEVVQFGMRALSMPNVWFTRHMLMAQFYVAAALLNLYLDDPDRLGKEEAFAQIAKARSEIDFYQGVCDVNYRMWHLILEALSLEIKGEIGDAIRMLEAALDHTQLNGWPIEEALVLELQANYYIRRDAKTAARGLVKRALWAWNRISGFGKSAQLTEKHGFLLWEARTFERTNDVGCQTVDTLLTQAPESRAQPFNGDKAEAKSIELENMDVIDHRSILEFSQVISSELQIDKLLSKMVRIILESCSGSELALVITASDNGSWRIASGGDRETGEKTFDGGLEFSEFEDRMALQITHYTLRGREKVLVHNIIDDERFSNVSNIYLSNHPQGRAIICLPIMQANKLLGAIQVEGQPRAFTQSNMTVLNLICNQAGISLANSFFFESTQRMSAKNEAMVQTQKQALGKAREAEQKAKEAEKEANHNVKLKEDAARAKSIFLANVSHDLRTPMNGVIGLSELLKETDLDEKQGNYVDSIRVCADTLLTLINDILDFSKLEAGKMKMLSVPLNLHQSITEVVRALTYTHQDSGINTALEMDGLDPNLIVLGDPIRLHQILMNLLSNSFKFTREGSITVSAKVGDEGDSHVRMTCTVKDTGIGIPEEQFARLFRPFSQADSSTERIYGGSGLGLSICKAIIEDVLGGKIWLQSEAGVGTTVTFTIVLPRATMDAVEPEPVVPHVIHQRGPSNLVPSKKSAPAPLPPPNQLKPGFSPQREIRDLRAMPRDKVRVCIAEDNPINQKIAVTFVTNQGLYNEAYSDGQQTVEALRRASREGNPFHIVLMDVQMPVLDGYNATRHIRADDDPNVHEVLVIAMTASAIQGDKEKCIDVGMNNYLAKPVRSDMLRKMLDQYLAPRLDSDNKVRPAGYRKVGTKRMERPVSTSSGPTSVPPKTSGTNATGPGTAEPPAAVPSQPADGPT